VEELTKMQEELQREKVERKAELEDDLERKKMEKLSTYEDQLREAKNTRDFGKVLDGYTQASKRVD
jgi:hypothetical protein